MKRKIFLGMMILLALSGITLSYDLILKNGKVIRGKLVSEDQEKIVVEDESGTKMNFKITSIDMEKTKAANQVVEAPPPPVAPEAPKEEVKAAEPAKPKKPARKFTEKDLYRLRSKYPMSGGSGAAAVSEDGQQEPAEQTGHPEERSEDEWKSISQDLLAKVQELEQLQKQSAADCQTLQGATIQTHIVTNEKGETQNMQETTKEICQQAEDAKAMLEQARQDYDSFLEEAKHEAVPPGWIARDE